jgi:dolichol-phosphate mannosyltransferase
MNDCLSIILPVFNEGENIKNVVYDIFDHIPSYIRNFETIVINDGSTDNTIGIVDELIASCLNLKILSHKKNMGYGYAIRSGIQLSTKEWVFIMDSDGQFHINDFKALWINRKEHDFILGFRKKRCDNVFRVFWGSLGTLIASLILRKRIIDINCGFKLFKKRDLLALSLCSTGGIIYFEVIYNLFKNNKNKFLQCPVNHYERKYGKQTGGCFSAIIKIVFEGIILLVKAKRKIQSML